MDSINLDSDCEIEEADISAISIPDSANGDGVVNSISTEDGEIEEVEVDINEESLKIVDLSATEDKEISCDKEELFVLNFHAKHVFQEIGHTVISALQTALQQDENDESIDIVCTPTEHGVCLKAFRMVLASTSDCLEVSQDKQLLVDCEEASTSQVAANRSDKEMSPDLTGLSELFKIDTKPANKLDTIKVPSYKRVIKDVLNEESAQKRKKNSEDECKRVRSVASCFNCGSTDHSMRDCHKPRNTKRIAKAKKAHSSKHDRYHVDIEQRFAHLRPGVISDKLRSALNLRSGELPFFFYRMRVLGYPPGWLEEAKVSHSGIMLFNSEGNPVLKPDEDDGELDNLNHKYDVSKIVGFPGFNVDPGDKFYDDYKHHNVPPMNQLHLKEEFIKTLGNKIIKGYKRKKLVDLESRPNEANDSMTHVVADMEIEDAELQPDIEFSRPMPPAEPRPDEIPPPPPTPTLAADESSSVGTSEERSQSPTLEDLEAKQLKLMQELQSNISNLTEPTEDSLIDEVMALETTQESIAELDNPEERTDQQEADPVTPSVSKQTSLPSDEKPDVFKESHMGTPILKFSPFEKLPDGDKFKAGVSDVIYFENLPDSTGKYEQMKVVIKKVRSMITKLNNEDD